MTWNLLMHRWIPVLVMSAMAVTSAAPAHAQPGDWDVKRDPFDKTLIRRYQRMLSTNPHDGRALRKLAGLYRRHRSIKLLIGEYEQRIASAPNDASAHIVLGFLARDAGDADGAARHLSRAAELAPNDAALLVALADLHRSGGRLDEARTALDRALASKPPPARQQQILRALADVALAAGDIDRARSYFDKYIALDPKNVNAQLELADALAHHDRHAEAIDTYRSAEAKLRADPALRVDVVRRIGATHEAMGDLAAAVKSYRRAMSMTGAGSYLRRELTERIIDIHRQRQELEPLLSYYLKEWPVRKRGYFEWDVLARLFEETGQQDQAIDAYRKATAKAPFELETQRRLITLLENAGRDQDALRQYERVIKVAPGEPRFQLELASRYWSINETAKALALAKRIANRFSADPGVHSTLADLYNRWGKPDLALASLERLTRIEPEDPGHLITLGDQHFQAGAKKKAVQVWKKLLRVKSAANYARLGLVYSDHDMLDQALEMFHRAIKMEPQEAAHYRGRATVYERQRRWKDAISDWETTLALIPDKSANQTSRRDARRRVVQLLHRDGTSHLSRRIHAWEQSFAAKPPDISAGYYLVEAFLRVNQTDQARAALEQLLVLRPNDLEAMHQLVKVSRATGDHERAISLLTRLAEITPARKREYFTQIAEIKTDLNQDAEAIEYVQKALELDPNDPLVHQRLAERYEKMQATDKAIAAYEKAIELSPRLFDAYTALARLYEQQGNYERQAALYRTILKTASDEKIIDQAGRDAIALAFLAGKLGDLERVLSPLAATYGHKPVYRRLLVELYKLYVDEDLRVRATSGEPAARASARAEIDRLSAGALKPLLTALADDKDVDQQRIAIDVLGTLGNRGAAAPLVRLAMKPLTESDRRRGSLLPKLGWDFRVKALVAAGRLGDPRIIPELTALSTHDEVAMREAAVYALGVTASASGTRALIAALSDQRSSVRTQACLSLARVGDKKAGEAVGAIVADEAQSDTTRAACAFALGIIGGSDAVSVLSDALTVGNGETQRLAAWALGALGDKRALSALIVVYFVKRDQVRDAVAWSMARLVSAEGAALVRTFPEFPTRLGKFDERAAVRSLAANLVPPSLTPSLIFGREADLVAGLNDSLKRHRDIKVRLLGDLDARDDGLALGPITDRLDAAPAGQRQKVRAALARIGTELVPTFAGLLADPDPEVRRRCLSLLAKLNDPRAADAIASAIGDAERSVRAAAMASAARYASTQKEAPGDLVSAVVARLSAPTWQERVAAARAMGGFGQHADAGALARVLASDPKGFVRAAAARSLGQLKRSDATAIEALTRAASPAEPYASVRQAAVRALRAIGGPAARRALDQVDQTNR